MSIDQANAERDERAERRSALVQARDLLAAALELLDEHSRSPAAATLDLAMHHLESELSG